MTRANNKFAIKTVDHYQAVSDIKSISPDELIKAVYADKASTLSALQEAKRANEQVYKQLQERMQGIIREATYLFGARSKVVNYLEACKRNTLPKPPNLDNTWKALMKAAAKEQTSLELKKKSQEAAMTLKAARKALDSAGFVAGKDYVSTRAITAANELMQRTGKTTWVPRIRQLSLGLNFQDDDDGATGT